jgi:ABC-type lipoprotein export system ATPase subunit
MTHAGSKYERGAEWRQWDLHIHTPASFHWTGERFDSEIGSEKNRRLVDAMINALNAAKPTVFAIMDYWTFEGWFALKRRLKDPDAPKLLKTVFPGIELRLMAPMVGRLNAHVVFSDLVSDQILLDFQAGLKVEIEDRPLSNDCLICLARRVGSDLLEKHGLKKGEVDSDEIIALHAGSMLAEINVDSYKKAIRCVPDNQAIGFMPFDTSDGLSDVKWKDNYAYFIGLFKSSPIFESRDSALRDCFIGEVTEKNKGYIKNFQNGLDNIPRLVVAGSDAHRFSGTQGDDDKRGYGDFPSNKATWIKADPTFQGLLQAIMEPAKRSFIGEVPPKVAAVQRGKTSFIDTIEIVKNTSAPVGAWLDGVKLPLNPDLVAIIGNKGSGKSALADVIALTGNSKQSNHFSFLKRDRFRGRSGDPAKHFDATLTWLDGSANPRNLNENSPEDKVEPIRYIPQGHFEDLCNGHISGTSDAFEKELRAVIFAHADDSVRLGALDFDQLVIQQEKGFRQKLEEGRKNLRQINQEIVNLEDELQSEVKDWLLEQKKFKERQILEHEKLRPIEVSKPSEVVSLRQSELMAELNAIDFRLKENENLNSLGILKSGTLARKKKALSNIQERVEILENNFRQFVEETMIEMESVEINIESIVSIKFDKTPLFDLAEKISFEQVELERSSSDRFHVNSELVLTKGRVRDQLGAPQQAYQNYMQAMNEWKFQLSVLQGNAESPDTLEGVNERLRQLEELPAKLLTKKSKRVDISSEIYGALAQQREARKNLFRPLQELIRSNKLIRDEYKLEFQAILGGSVELLASPLFSLIKQSSGEFRGEDESIALVRKLMEDSDFDDVTGARSFVKSLDEKLQRAAHAGKGTGIRSLLRKDRLAHEVYDLIFGLAYLEPRYSLVFQQTQIEQLSPGQRGALLLIFYLLVDKDSLPIILDQPEENLDNETVVNLLVPVLTEAKKTRQIIMVTHNPNLAVVCDAEQIIWSIFDRRNDSKITYISGAIENPKINTRVVDVLEGTMRAFNNRGSKYFN